jgi:hypothetical protein
MTMSIKLVCLTLASVALAAAVVFSVGLFKSLPPTELLTEHPYLQKCYSVAQPFPIQLGQLDEASVDCSVVPTGCSGWFAKGGNKFSQTKILPRGGKYQLKYVVHHSSDQTDVTEHYILEPLDDPSQPTILYAEFSSCLGKPSADNSGATTKNLLCFKTDFAFQEFACP